MKKLLKITAAALMSAATLFTLSCTSSDIANIVGGLTSSVSTPTLSFKSIGINSLDMEGITFNCNYDIHNPYGVAVSLSKLAADISCNGSKVTSLTANEGISLAARSTKTNSFNFKLPYNSVLNLAKSYKASSDNLPFQVNGSAALDLSRVTGLTNKAISLPFAKNFDVPVVKPNLSVSSPKLVLPSVTEMVSSFKNSGMSATKAATVAASIAAGKSVDPSVFDKVDLNMKLKFDLNVKNEGSSAWNYLVKSCAIKTGESKLVDLDLSSAKSISSADGTVPLTANLNTLTAGKFIAQILSKSGTNPTFDLQSGLSFPKSSYAPNLPLNYSKTLPLSSIGLTKN